MSAIFLKISNGMALFNSYYIYCKFFLYLGIAVLMIFVCTAALLIFQVKKKW